MKKHLFPLFYFFSILGFASNEKGMYSLRDFENIQPIRVVFLDTVDKANQRSDKLISNQFFDLEIGNSITTFHYINSSGESNLDFINGQSRFIDLNYSFKLFKNFYLRSGVNLMGFNPTSKDQQNGNFYSWNTTYAGIGTGFNWKFFSLGKLQFHVNTKIGFSALLAGEQQINRKTYNLKDQNDFTGDHWFYKHGLIIYYRLSERIMLGINGSILTNAKDAFGPYPRQDNENIKLKSKNIGITLLFSANE